MTPINKFIVLTAVAALMIGTLVPASDQAYAEVTIIIGSDGNESRLSVTQSGTPTDMLVRKNITSLTNDTTTITNAESLNSVSVIAMRVPINLADILSLAGRYGIQLGQYPFFR
jgi:YbbR domain-containing protein